MVPRRYPKSTSFPLIIAGKLLAAHCEKKILIYSAEDGKRIYAAEANENSTCRWLKIAENDTLILALIDKKSFAIKWIINCEFELKGGALSFILYNLRIFYFSHW